MDVELTGDDMKKLAGPDSLILSYPELYKYKTIEQLFSNGINKIIILYLQTPNSGHWCCLTLNNNIVTFFDPYNLMPDSELKFNKQILNKELNQEHTYLTKLLLDFAIKGGTVEYNEMRFQKLSNGVSTCGRHAGLRARYYQIPLNKYQKIFKDLKKEGYDLDKVSIFISDYLLNQ